MLKVVNLAARPEPVLHDALHHEFSNYTQHPEVRMYGDRDMYSLVRFRNAWECKSALRGAQGLLIFGAKIKISAVNKSEFPSGGRMHPPPHPIPGHHGGMLRGPPGHGPMGGPPGMGPSRMQSFPPPKDLDPSATRSLFIGNIPKNLSIYELRDTFQRFGPILDVEIKKMSGNATYGFILFFDLMNAVQAKRCMDGERLAGNKIRVGFGKGTPTKTLWVDGIDPALSDSQLEKHFGKYGKVVRLGVDRQTHTAMVQYDTLDNAKDAIESIRGSYIGASDTRLLADYANRDAKAAFFSQMEGPGGPKPFMQSTGAGGMFMEPMGMGPPWMMHGPRPMPMMAMGMGPPHGPPMEYYYGDPYMEADYYGMPPFPPPAHMRRYPPGHHPFDAGPGFNNDYEDELRRFYRRREWDKRQENKDRHHQHKDSSSESDDSSDNSNERSSKTKRKSSRSTRPQSTSSKSADDDEPKKRRSREKAREEKQKQDDREAKNPKRKKSESDEGAESDSSDEREKERERARLKSTRRLRESREKRQKNKLKEIKNASSDKEDESKKQDKSSPVSPVSSVGKEAGAKMAPIAKATEKEERIGVKKHAQAADGPKPEPKLKKKSKDEREGLKTATKREPPNKKEVTEEALLSSPLEITPPCKESSRSVMEDFDMVDASLDKVEVNHPPPSSSAKVGGVSSSSVSEDRPKISFELRGRENPVKPDVMVAVLESDFSSGDEFRLDDEEEELSPVPSSPPPPPPPPETNVTKARKVASSVRRTHVPDTKEKPPKEARTPKSSLGQTDAPRPSSTMGSKTKEHQPTTYSYSDTSSESSSSSYSRRRHSEELADEHRRGSTESWSKRQQPAHRRGSHDSGRDSYHHRQQTYHLSQSPSPPHVEWQTRRRPRSPPPVSQETRHRRLHSPAHRRLSSPRRRSPQSPPPRRSYSPRADPPQARPRTPIQRPKPTRRTRGNESPSQDSQRSWYARRPPSPVTAYNQSPSPPPRSRSPIHRHHIRNHSLSPPLQSRQTKRPLSPVRRRQDSDSPPSSHSRAVKRPQSPSRRRQDSTHDNPPESKRRKGDDWQGASGRTKERHRERDRERERREQAAKPRTPSGSPPLPKSEAKPPKKSTEVESAPSKPRTGSNNIQPPLPKAQSGHSIQPPLPKSDYPSPPSQPPQAPPLPAGQQSQDDLLGLLRRYPVMWQGHLILKSDLAAVQLHFLSGNSNLARLSLPVATEANPPNLRIAQRMRLEPAQLEGVEKRIQLNNEHCLLLALPCGRDPEDVQAQTHSLKTSLIAYLLQKQAAGIINVPCQQPQAQTAMHVLHIFPPCPFSQRHLQRVAPDLLSSASEDCHLMIVVATA